MSLSKFVALPCAIALTLSGCTEKPSNSGGNAGASITINNSPPPTVDVHAHASDGPHHGSLIELGNEEYHAELVHDAASVTIYILDSAAKNSVPIEATELVINLLHEGKPEQFKLPANPDTGDTDGKSSRFALEDAELAEHIDEEATKPELAVNINGTQFRGKIEHDREGHDHAH